MKELLNIGVSIELEYEESTDALIGQIKGYTVVVKENLSTGSYGCFFWAKEGDFAAITDMTEYLTDKQKLEPELIKKFRVTELGAAVALNRVDDAFVNVNMLKKFAYDFVTNLSINFFKNCCCECGGTGKLALYDINGTPAQACSECGKKYKLVCSFDEDVSSSDTKISAIPDFAKPLETTLFEKEPILAETKKASEENKEVIEQKQPVSDAEEFSELVLTEIPKEEKPTQDIAQPKAENISFDALLLDAEEEAAPPPPKSKIFEEAEREFAAEKARIAEEESLKQPDDSIEDFLLVAEEPEDDTPAEDVSEYYKEKDIEGNFTVEEIERTVDMPTITNGPLQLSAEETPLDENGKVPLINPMTNQEERRPSDPNGPNAVQPLEMTRNSEQLFSPVGYATGENMDRDGDPPPYNPTVVHSSSYKKSPPPYNHNYRYRKVKPITYINTSNPLTGIIGAIVLGIVGMAVWFFIGTLVDEVTYWGSLLMVVAVFGGYRLMGRAMDKKGIIISFLLTIVMTMIGMIAIYTIQVTRNGIHITFFEMAEWFSAALGDENRRGKIINDFGMSFAVTAVAGLITSIVLWKKT